MPHAPRRHSPAQLKPTRPSARQRGYTARWERYRAWYLLQPENILCRARDCYDLAEIVDHIKPHRGDDALFWDPANHQPLCKRCHDRKTATEDGGFGRARRTI